MPTMSGDGGCSNASRIPTVAVHHDDATDVVLRPGRSEFTWRGQRISMPLTGAINVDNALLAAEAALALEEPGLGPEEIGRAMAHLAPVPGRLQVIAAPGPSVAGAGQGGRPAGERPSFTVLVDYAHTPAGLQVVLAEARRLAPAGRVLCLFGCGGNRDRAKRPLMGAAAADVSDLAFVTSDNPRDEDPLRIIEEVLGGVPGGRGNPRIVVEPDRGVAIRLALDAARSGRRGGHRGKGPRDVSGDRGATPALRRRRRGPPGPRGALRFGAPHLGPIGRGPARRRHRDGADAVGSF